MNINVICIGKLKENYWTEAIKEYSKRLSKYCNLKVYELKESKLPANSSEMDEENVKIEEGKAILKQIKTHDYVFTLEIKGNGIASTELAEKIDKLADSGQNNIDFIIGGSLGLSNEVSQRSDYKLSFSKMTFPHQMMRVILLEQIYRSYKIAKNETYHK